MGKTSSADLQVCNIAGLKDRTAMRTD